MPADPCARAPVLSRPGLTQPGRQLPELSRRHFLPDERDLPDLVLFGRRFARQLKFHDATNAVSGTWEAFFAADVTAALAELARPPLEAARRWHQDLAGWLRADPARDPAALGPRFRLWFQLPLVQWQAAGRALDLLPEGHPLALAAPLMAARDLAAPLAGLAGWYRGAVAAPALFADAAPALADLGPPGPQAPARLAELFAAPGVFGSLDLGARLSAGLGQGGWPGLYAATPADGAPFADAAAPYERIFDGLTWNLLVRAADRLFEAFARLRREAAAALEASLADFAAHAPHYGLWLAFLRLFRHAQEGMNAFTGRHLDFYQREVLGLRPLPPAPDHAHLTFGLAKGTDRLLLPAGHAFAAGKDGTGRPVTFTLDADLVVNRARVARLCAIRRRVATPATGREVSLEAASDIASADGLGEVPLPEGAGMPPFGPDPSPAARVGFAVADRRLFLREGARFILLIAPLTADRAVDVAGAEVTVRLSAADGWHLAEGHLSCREMPHEASFDDFPEGPHDRPRRARSKAAQAGGARVSSAATSRPMPAGARAGRATRQALVLSLELPPEAPSILPVDPAVHGDTHAPGLPVMEVLFGFSTPAARRAFAELEQAGIARPRLVVQASGLRRMTLQAAGAEADPVRPFAPFGPRPKAGDALILGCAEAFAKPLDRWALTLRWQAPCTPGKFFLKLAPETYRARMEVLSRGMWASVGASGVPLQLDTGAGTSELDGTDRIAGQGPMTAEDPVYGAEARDGFLRLTLNQDFGHDRHPEELTRASVALASGNGFQKNDKDFNYSEVEDRLPMPLAPYDPVLTGIELEYVSAESRVEGFLHLWPFGADAAQERRLVPVLPYEAALFVGLADHAGPARVTLLMQVLNGTGDPLLPLPDLRLARLGEGGFVDLPSRDVDDLSLGLTTPGVLGVTLPGPETGEGPPSAEMPPGLTWLRLSVDRHPAAVNRLAAVIAQAGRATFAEDGNDPQRLSAPLPAGAITRPLQPDPRLKTVAQPFAGFGGRPAETAPAMDLRVAERLRHKDRAITPWDIEALVLQAFPQVYRLRCLPLTEALRAPDGTIRAENAARPGAVTVVALPVLGPGSAANPLRPYLDQATLGGIARLLAPRLSPFVRLEVTNPRIEEVHLDLQVRFAPHVTDPGFARAQLEADLVAFLTPWANPAAGAEVAFGGRLWKSGVIDFVDSRPDVDFVTEVLMFHKPDANLPDGDWTKVDTDLIEVLSPRSVLVSAPRHSIDWIRP